MRCRNINPITITWVVAWMLIATMSASAGIRSTFPKMASATRTAVEKVVHGGATLVKMPVNFVRKVI
jgi:hypothetical protein